MIIAFWVLAAVLAVFDLYAGGKKVTQSRDQLRPMMKWVDDVPFWLVRTVGGIEIFGAVGLVLPMLTGTAVWLGTVAAFGLAVLQVLAAGLHVSRGEYAETILNAVLLTWALVIAWLSLSV